MALVLFVLFLALRVITIQSSLFCVQECDQTEDPTVTCKVIDNGALECVAPMNCPARAAMNNCTNGGNLFDCAVNLQVVNITTLTVRYIARALCRNPYVTTTADACELDWFSSNQLTDVCRCQEDKCNSRVVVHNFTTLVPIYPVPSTVRVEGTAVGETTVSVVAYPSAPLESTFVAGELKYLSHNTLPLTLLHVNE